MQDIRSDLEALNRWYAPEVVAITLGEPIEMVCLQIECGMLPSVMVDGRVFVHETVFAAGRVPKLR